MTLLKGTRNKFIDSKGNCENVRLTWPGCFAMYINNKNCSTTVSSFRACWRNTFPTIPTRIVCFCPTRRKASFLCHLFCTFPDCKNRWRSKGDFDRIGRRIHICFCGQRSEAEFTEFLPLNSDPIPLCGRDRTLSALLIFQSLLSSTKGERRERESPRAAVFHSRWPKAKASRYWKTPNR